MQISVLFVDRQLKRPGRLDFEGRNSYSIIPGSGAATVKGRTVDILMLLFNMTDSFPEMKPTTLKDSYNCKIKSSSASIPPFFIHTFLTLLLGKQHRRTKQNLDPNHSLLKHISSI